MNKIFIIGNLTRDPETRYTSSNVSVCSFTVAVNIRGYGSQNDGMQQDLTNFYRVSAWRALGETCQKYLAKGRRVAVTGNLVAREYTGNDGQRRTSLDIQADSVEFLSSGQQNQGGYPADDQQGGFAPAPQQRTQQVPPGFQPIDDDELPF